MWSKYKVISGNLHFYITSLFMFIPLSSKNFGTLPQVTCKYQEHSLKWKSYSSYDHSLKWSLYQVITWKLLCSDRDKKFFAESLLPSNFFLVGRQIIQFLASEWRLSSILLVRKSLQFLPNMSPNFKILYLMIHYADVFLT